MRSIIRPRISETNLGGHIGAVVIPVWLEEARFEFINAALNGQSLRHFLVRYELDFRKEIFYGVDVVVETTVQKIGSRSVVFQQTVRQNDIVCAEGISTIAHIDSETKKTKIIPHDIKRLLESGPSST